MKIGRNFRINNDIIELFVAFGIRAEANVTVDLKARCTTADRGAGRVYGTGDGRCGAVSNRRPSSLPIRDGPRRNSGRWRRRF